MVMVIIGLIFYIRLSQLRKIAETKTEFSRRLIESQEAERKRIASELHDGIGQTLAAASINLARHHDMLNRENRSGEIDTPLERRGRHRNTAEQAVREGRITPRERQQLIKLFNDSMNGYTYYERDE